MGILGYCPGTMAARIGEGKKEAILAALGMSLGIVLYALTIKPVKAALLSKEINGDIFVLLRGQPVARYRSGRCALRPYHLVRRQEIRRRQEGILRSAPD